MKTPKIFHRLAEYLFLDREVSKEYKRFRKDYPEVTPTRYPFSIMGYILRLNWSQYRKLKIAEVEKPKGIQYDAISTSKLESQESRINAKRIKYSIILLNNHNHINLKQLIGRYDIKAKFDIELICLVAADQYHDEIVKEFSNTRYVHLLFIKIKGDDCVEAYNHALTKVTGEYVIFSDSHVRLDLEILNKFYNELQSNDNDIYLIENIELANIKKLIEDSWEAIKHEYIDDSYSAKINIEKLLNEHGFSLNNKIISNEFIRKNKLTFQQNNKYNGIPFVFECLSYTNSVMYLHGANINNNERNINKGIVRNSVKIKVTIIIPFTNDSCYLPLCLDSIVKQKLADIEIICVNVGSTDNSSAIIREYLKNDNRIILLNSAENQSQSYGKFMNNVLERVNGEYIGIVNPEDFVAPEMYKTLYDFGKIADLDIVKTEILIFSFDAKGILQITDEHCITNDLSLSNFITNGIYKRDFIEKNNIKFKESQYPSIAINNFYYDVYKHADKIKIIPYPLYFKRRDNLFKYKDQYNGIKNFVKEAFNGTKISVIIPIYNAEKYLSECLYSVCNQTLQEIEVICINDGSLDDTARILDEWSTFDSRIKIIDQENAGSGPARNAGIRLARSEYLAFIDSDDFYPDNDILENLFNAAIENNALICGGSFSKLSNDKIISSFKDEYEKYTFKEEKFINFVDYQFDYGYHRFIYKTKFIQDNQINFPPYYRYQDPCFMLNAMITAEKFYAIPKIVYCYRKRSHENEIIWSTRMVEDLLQGLIYTLTKSVDYSLPVLHKLILKRINVDFYDVICEKLADGNQNILQLLNKLQNLITPLLLSYNSNNCCFTPFLLEPLYSRPDLCVKVSVVIPVFNSALYLKQCLDSICTQTLHNIEILCIDDGSTDQSLKILYEYAQLDNRIRVISKNHTNAGDTRNRWIGNVKGDYLAFVDADTIADKHMLEYSFNCAKLHDADICIFADGLYDHTLGKPVKSKNISILDDGYYNIILSSLELQDKLFNFDKCIPWNKLFKRSFLETEHFEFQSISSSNDLFFTYSALSLASRIIVIEHVLIYHQQNIIKKLSEPIEYQLFNYYFALDRLKSFLELHDVYTYFRDSFVTFALKYSIMNICKFGIFFEDLMKEHFKRKVFNELDLYYNDDLALHDEQLFHSLTSMFTHSFQIHNNIKNQGSSLIPKVSVVVPIYNAESYLRLALDSLIYQTLDDIEIICINDGSTDHSLEILNEYAERDSRITVLTDINKGYGYAMNCGLNIAKGEYIGILEPDDFINVNMFKELYENAKKYNTDIMKADFYRFTHDHNGYLLLHYNKVALNDNNYNVTINPKTRPDVFNFIMNTWSGIYKRSFLEKYNIRHNETPGASFQDNGFWFKSMMYAKNVRFLNKPFYINRRDNPNSSVKDSGKIYAMNTEYKLIDDYLTINDCKSDYLQPLNFMKLKNYQMTLNRIAPSNRREYLNAISKEFNQLAKDDQLDLNMLNPVDRSRWMWIMRDPDEYYYRMVHNPYKLSLILPITYWDDETDRCLNLICSLNFKEMEVLCLIHDSLSCPFLYNLEFYASKDSRIKIINVDIYNDDLRNFGINIAQGEYIYFMNQQDFLENPPLKNIYDIAHLHISDILVLDHPKNDKIDDKIYLNLIDKRANCPVKKNFTFDKLKNHMFNAISPWCNDKFYSRSFLLNNNLEFQFNPSTSQFKDIYFVFKSLMLAARITRLDVQFNNYRFRDTTVLSKDYQRLLCSSLYRLYRFIDSNGFENYKQNFINYILLLYKNYFDPSNLFYKKLLIRLINSMNIDKKKDLMLDQLDL